ncbi:hypothetical protein BV898_00632 [Hypsibius exemplaris]|uniref:Uncharacterized protein n=1 Tax=Hypsibius exemplaris TaxID=2072580 RepID=A0A1W0XEA6_HYPEX|nr:hypothetical protein BV898_00632 [Hypsibius exemplaris]
MMLCRSEEFLLHAVWFDDEGSMMMNLEDFRRHGLMEPHVRTIIYRPSNEGSSCLIVLWTASLLVGARKIDDRNWAICATWGGKMKAQNAPEFPHFETMTFVGGSFDLRDLSASNQQLGDQMDWLSFSVKVPWCEME